MKKRPLWVWWEVNGRPGIRCYRRELPGLVFQDKEVSRDLIRQFKGNIQVLLNAGEPKQKPPVTR